MAKTRRRKKRTHVPSDNDEGKKPDPKTLVFKRGTHGNILADLEQDVRRMMLPNTAANLRESRRNTLRDFLSVAGPLGVSHFVMMSATDNSSYIKLAKTPRGPTVTMRIRSYSLIRNVQAAAARPRVPVNAFKTPPLVVMNGFSGNETLRLVTTMFQGMFPALNVQRTKLSACQRVVLLSRDKETGIIRLRHYSIAVAPSGLRKSVKALLSRREVPDLGSFRDVSEFVTKSGYGSESEGEDAEASRVTLAQDLGRGNVASRQSRVRLHELGPRMDLELVKIEEGLCEGTVLFHAHVSKTREEVAELANRQEQRQALRDQRRKQQEENVRRKASEAARKAAAQADQLRQEGKLPAGKKMWWEQDPTDNAPWADEDEEGESEGESEEEGAEEGEEGGGGAAGAKRKGAAAAAGKKRRRTEDDDEDDDAAYFREEVGRDPEADEMVGAHRAATATAAAAAEAEEEEDAAALGAAAAGAAASGAAAAGAAAAGATAAAADSVAAAGAVAKGEDGGVAVAAAAGAGDGDGEAVVGGAATVVGSGSGDEPPGGRGG
ncbi:hypothetical protein PLESTM_000570100 [Pleodorina starrii]|nr:hypothetical protein PLESTM_000570100 [Pleodorina starrii]